jgi:cytochrome c5
VKPVSKIEATIPIVCDGCHSTGVLGAPKVGSKTDWAERAKQGIEVLAMNASKGKGNMPPQGVSFSNNQLKEAIEAMLVKSELAKPGL